MEQFDKIKSGIKRNWNRDKLQYAVGAMLYTPALNTSIADSVINKSLSMPYSLTLCLEDSISDNSVEKAEAELENTVKKIYGEWKSGGISDIDIPLIFVRVRNAAQLKKINGFLKEYYRIIAGYVFPKFSLGCADDYIETIKEINGVSKERIYMMPILESGDIIDLRTRHNILYLIKEKLDCVKDFVLNIRVGGNDFCKEFGIRRNLEETIYDIKTVSSALADILTVFSREYVVPGPVWEYFAGKGMAWEEGLKRETRLDILNGFVGKTVIHPLQIAPVNSCLAVSRADYADACDISGWNCGSLGVSKSGNGERMNELKTHLAWAEKILCLAEFYGVSKDDEF